MSDLIEIKHHDRIAEVALNRNEQYHAINLETEDIFNGKPTIVARRICPKNLWKIVTRKLDQLDSISTLDELRIPPANQLEALSGDRKGQFSIRINDQYRICFKWSESGPEDVEITDYH